MASGTDISVAIESAVHGAIRDLVVKVYRDHGIRIDSASIERIDVSSAAGEEFLVRSISAKTTTGQAR